MHSTLCFLAALLVISQSAFAEDAQVKLLNPDGTPAVDAKAIAIMKIWSRVDADLKELPSLTMQMPEEGGTKAAKNEAGVITYDSKAIAVVAQNQAGFVFVPLPLKGNSAKLRPWAKLSIDASVLDPQLRASRRIAVLWENCFAGYPPRPSSMVEQEDPFGGPMVPKHDWRFDSFVMWSLSLEAKESQVVNVPPGEVTILISDKDVSTVDWQKPFSHVRLRPVRTRSGTEARSEVPELIAVKGELVDANVPDWNGGKDNARFVFANQAGAPMPEEMAKLFTGLDHGSGTILDELASRYASEAGTKYRYGLLPQATVAVKDDDTFEIPGLPPGKYDLHLFQQSGGSAPLKARGAKEETPIVFEVKPQSPTVHLGELLLAILDEPKVAADRLFAPEPTEDKRQPVQALPNEYGTDPVLAAEQRINAVLARVADPMDYQGFPLWQVADELQKTYWIPILVNEQSLAEEGISTDSPVTFKVGEITLQSALRHLLASVSNGLTFVVRDEVLLITTKEDAQSGLSRYVGNSDTEQLDNGATFIEQWRKTASDIEDRETLRKALQKHLEQEFDANQISRQEELERLRKLLKKSEEWIKTRQAKRPEIIQKKVAELLEAGPKQ